MKFALGAAQSVIWIGLTLGGAWLFAAFELAPAPYPYQLWLMLTFWLVLLGSVTAIGKVPTIAFIAACIKAAGDALLQSPPGGVPHPWQWFLYYHSVDLALVIAVSIVWVLTRRRNLVFQAGGPTSADANPTTNSGNQVRP